jgi:hypothetical protein
MRPTEIIIILMTITTLFAIVGPFIGLQRVFKKGNINHNTNIVLSACFLGYGIVGILFLHLSPLICTGIIVLNATWLWASQQASKTANKQTQA